MYTDFKFKPTLLWSGTKKQQNHAQIPMWRKTEPEVNSHNVISRMSGTSVGRSQRLYEIFEPNLVQSSRNRQPSWQIVPNSLIMDIQDDGGRHIECR